MSVQSQRIRFSRVAGGVPMTIIRNKGRGNKLMAVWTLLVQRSDQIGLFQVRENQSEII